MLAFEALELGRCGDTHAKGTQLGLCNVTRRLLREASQSLPEIVRSHSPAAVTH